jgi:hypothetical protein
MNASSTPTEAPSIADLTKSQTHTVEWVNGNWTSGHIEVDNSFQRRFVWQRKHQVRLIETILLGYATPEIYLWRLETDSATGKTRYSIVDGQQRIRSIVDFINNVYPLSPAYLGPDGLALGVAGKKFHELGDLRRKIWGYSLTMNLISDAVSRAQIKKMFLRLNSTNMSLNPQELRHAEFDGEFIKVAERIANNPVWRENDIKLFGEPEVRRMRDVQFVTSILIYLRRGISEELSQANINAIYDSFNTNYPEAADDEAEVIKLVRSAISIADGYSVALKLLRAKIHLYTLMVAIPRLDLADPIPDEIKSRYRQFVDAYVSSPFSEVVQEMAADGEGAPTPATATVDDVDADVPLEAWEKVAEEYRMLSIEGVQKRQNRTRRVALLVRWLKDGEFQSVIGDAWTEDDGAEQSDELEIIDGSEVSTDVQTPPPEQATFAADHFAQPVGP